MKTSPKLLLILSFALLTFCYKFEEQQQGRGRPTLLVSQTSNLGFGNQTGANVTAGQVQAFINFINSASVYYRDSVLYRLTYISSQLNAAYGKNGYGYSVFLADNKNYTWSIYANGVYASVAPGVDRIFPTASYMFIQNYMYNAREYFFYEDQKGSGIDTNLENVIRNTILTYETTAICSCFTSDASNIATALSNYDGNLWSVLCSVIDDMYALTYSYGSKYIYTKPKACYYAIYAR